jgi:hypothetical protein
MSSSVLNRLSSCARVTSRLRLGIMVHHYKFIILMEILATKASDDRPTPHPTSDFYMRLMCRPAVGRPRDSWGAVGSLVGIIRVRGHVPGVHHCCSGLWLHRPHDRFLLRVLSLKGVHNTRQVGESLYPRRCWAHLYEIWL